MSKQSEIPAYTLFTMPSNRSQRRTASTIGLIIAVITLMCVPFAGMELHKSNTFLPTLLGTVICFEWMTIFVFYNQFRIHRSPQILVLCAGYAYTSLMTLAYLILFPGFFPPNVFDPGKQTAEYLYVFWHAGFPVAILVYTLMERWFKEVRWNDKQALRGTILLGAGVVVIVACIVYVSFVYERRLPHLIDFGHVSKLFTFGFALPILVLSCAALAFYYRLTRARTVTSSWLCVALLANILDVGIVLCGGNRFSLGWYVSKLDAFIFANIVLAAIIYEFIQMYVKMTGLYDQSRKAERKIAEQNRIIERMLAETVHKAHNDELTGLPNRRYIGEWLDRRASLQQATEYPYAVLFLDLDGFKQVNDTLGHEIGDTLLQEVAAALNRNTDEQGIAARWAGDEFVILVERVEQYADLERLADRVISAVRSMERVKGHPVAISGSMGIALGNEAGLDAKTILHQADQAMYEAKSNGKNRYCFYNKTA